MATLRRGSFYHAGDQSMLHFEEKGGKSREIPVRHDLEQMIFEYLDAAGLRNAHKDTPLFRTAYKKTGQPGVLWIVMNLVPYRMETYYPTPRNALGFTFFTHERDRCSFATVFCDRVKNVARSSTASVAQILGCTMAHELATCCFALAGTLLMASCALGGLPRSCRVRLGDGCSSPYSKPN